MSAKDMSALVVAMAIDELAREQVKAALLSFPSVLSCLGHPGRFPHTERDHGSSLRCVS